MRQLRGRRPSPAGLSLRIAPRTLICGSAWRLGGSGAETGFDELRELCEAAYRGMALIHAPGGDVQRGLDLMQQVAGDAHNDRYSRAALPPFECEVAREEARSGRLDHAVDRVRAVVDDLYRTDGWGWISLAIRVFVDLLLQRGGAANIAEAEAAAERLAKASTLDGSAIRDINVVRMRALVSRAQGDDAAYRTYRHRYRQMADALGFEGHLQLAAEMP